MDTVPLSAVTVTGNEPEAWAAGAAVGFAFEAQPLRGMTTRAATTATRRNRFKVLLSVGRGDGLFDDREACRSTSPFPRRALVATGRPGDLARPPRRIHSCGTAPDSHRTSLTDRLQGAGYVVGCPPRKR